ncbi:MAG: hypothetical protein J6C30_04550 [Lentisphaeria bacterium]|nr:hypothetical protein [Lentisphaeria bacterium]
MNNTLLNINEWKQEINHLLTQEGGIPTDELDYLLRRGFAGEELLMICSGYPGYERQYIAHRCFLAALQDQEKDQVQPFLLRWMKQHDQLYDRQFQEYYANWEQKKLNSKLFQEDPELLLLKAKIARLE